MMHKRWWVAALVVVMSGAMWMSQSYAQEGGRRGGQGQFDPEQMRQRMEEMRQQRADRMKQQLGVDDADWQVIAPRIEKIEQLRGQAMLGGGMRGGRGGGFAGPGGGGRGQGFNRGQAAEPADLPETARAMRNLRETLDDEQASNDDVRAALTELRQAQEKARKELADAREDLRTLVTLRQEAQLVTMGILE